MHSTSRRTHYLAIPVGLGVASLCGESAAYAFDWPFFNKSNASNQNIVPTSETASHETADSSTNLVKIKDIFKLAKKAQKWFVANLPERIESAPEGTINTSYFSTSNDNMGMTQGFSSTWGAHNDSGVLPARIIQKKPLKPISNFMHSFSDEASNLQLNLTFRSSTAESNLKQHTEEILALKNYSLHSGARYEMSDPTFIRAIIRLETDKNNFKAHTHTGLEYKQTDLNNLQPRYKATIDTGLSCILNRFLTVEGDVGYNLTWRPDLSVNHKDNQLTQNLNGQAHVKGKVIVSWGPSLMGYVLTGGGYDVQKSRQWDLVHIKTKAGGQSDKSRLSFQVEGGIKLLTSDDVQIHFQLGTTMKRHQSNKTTATFSIHYKF